MQDGTCKHFNGNVNECCRAGVNYNSVTTDPDEAGAWLRRPCHSKQMFENPNTIQIEDFNRRGKCDKFELPTAEEIAVEEKFFEEMFARTMKCEPVIQKMKKEWYGKDHNETVRCPICDGNLMLSHAGINGHVWGKCETENCVSWME